LMEDRKQSRKYLERLKQRFSPHDDNLRERIKVLRLNSRRRYKLVLYARVLISHDGSGEHFAHLQNTQKLVNTCRASISVAFLGW
jgi:predicted nuclease of restriction endonuclease-like (RecB) superfamily